MQSRRCGARGARVEHVSAGTEVHQSSLDTRHGLPPNAPPRSPAYMPIYLHSVSDSKFHEDNEEDSFLFYFGGDDKQLRITLIILA